MSVSKTVAVVALAVAATQSCTNQNKVGATNLPWAWPQDGTVCSPEADCTYTGRFERMEATDEYALLLAADTPGALCVLLVGDAEMEASYEKLWDWETVDREALEIDARWLDPTPEDEDFMPSHCVGRVLKVEAKDLNVVYFLEDDY